MNTETARTIAYDEHMEAIWQGSACGFSHHQLVHDLDDDRCALADLNAHRIAPRLVIGRHVRRPMTAARAYLTGRIADGVDHIATRGRSHPLNQSNATYAVRTGTFTASRYACECATWDAITKASAR